MAESKFAFEYNNGVSIAFPLIAGLGDCVIAKKVFDAIIEVEPTCIFDIFCATPNHMNFTKAFFGSSRNLNLAADYRNIYPKVKQSYDVALFLYGSRAIILDHVNFERLSKKSPALAESVAKISVYNKKNFYEVGSANAASLRNAIISRILGKNCYYLLSSDGALPIHDDKVNLPLAPDFKPQFDALKLDKYITVYTDIYESENARPKVKTWPMNYWHEYVNLLKAHLPNVEIVQCGGGSDVKVANADRYYLSVDLELTKYILANSLLHVGCEGGLVHLATALGTKCLVLFGPSHSYCYGYTGNINLVSDICFPCFDVWADASTKICARGDKEPPCMLSHTPQKVCEVTCTYLKSKT